MDTFIYNRRAAIHMAIEGLSFLIDNASESRCEGSEADAMGSFDALCGFSGEDFDRAHDRIFAASDSHIIPQPVVADMSKCRAALREVVAGYTGTDAENYMLWDALDDLFDIEELREEANKYAHVPACDRGDSREDDWREWAGKE